MSSSFLELQRITTNRPDSFPYGGMRIMGALQINTGIIVFALGMADIILTMTSYDSDVTSYGSKYEAVVSLTLVSSPLWCGIWFAIAGALGTCITRQRAHSLQLLKIAFLVINILCSAVFGPVCMFINGYISYTRHSIDSCRLQWLVTLFICFLGVLEIIMCTASASVTCCCSPLNATQVHVLVNPRCLKDGKFVVEPIDQQKKQLALTAPDDHGDRYAIRKIEGNIINNNTNINNNNTMKTEEEIKKISAKPRTSPFIVQTVQSNRSVRAEVDVPIYDSFGDDSRYPKQKKWAFPHW
ncbi:uncharacterized protein LOC131932166 [Physella acuta]|uniref:uncharacterized protein LOC131932166 n=1 Tax=Physella acuta TaxID=109671 RepID=UPI0027DB16FE|nr:uncharacterized protein LOC131932166 [Physella acuta]